MFSSKIFPSSALNEMSIKKNEIEVSFNGHKKSISFEALFKPQFHVCNLLIIKLFDRFRGKRNLIIHTEQKNLIIFDTQIPIPGKKKTLKFYVEKKLKKMNGKSVIFYNYWPKNVRLINAALELENDLSFDVHVLKINDLHWPIEIKKGGFNNRSLVSVGSTHPNYHQKMLYSVSLINKSNYNMEVTELKKMILNIEEFLSVNKKLASYRDNLGLPFFIKDKQLDEKQNYLVYTKMLNGDLGSLGINDDKIKYHIKDVKYAYEGLLLLFAAGFCHNDIKPQNIVKNTNGYFFIDFSFMEKIKPQKLSFNGTPEFMAPKKYSMKDSEYNTVANDLYAFCLSFILPYLTNINPNNIQFFKKEEIDEKNTAFNEKINAIYSEDDPLNAALKRMGYFFFSLIDTSSNEMNNHRVTYFVGFIAKGLGIQDTDLISKAMLNAQLVDVETNSLNFQDAENGNLDRKNVLISKLNNFIWMNNKLDSYLRCLSFVEKDEMVLPVSTENAIYLEKGYKWENLDQVIPNGASFQIEHIKQAYEGLLLLFAAGYIHGDIKPNNIVKNETGFLLANFKCSENIKKEGFSIKGTKGFIYPKKFNAARIEFDSMENDLYAFCLTFILPYLEIFPTEFLNKGYFEYFTNIQNKNNFLKKIDDMYGFDDSAAYVLKMMYGYCFALSNKHITSISFDLIDIAWKLGIRDMRLVGKAVENSRTTKHEKEIAINRFKEHVRNERFSVIGDV